MLVASTSQADSGRTLEGTDPTVNRSFAWERAHLRRNPGINFVMTLGVVLAGFWFDAAMAQEGYFGHDHDKWHHGFYQTLERPDTKSPCCNLTDCRPTSARQVDGHYEVKVNGAWVSVPSGKILKQSAPDLGFHVCAPFKFDGQPDHLYTVSLSRQKSRVHRAMRPLARRCACATSGHAAAPPSNVMNSRRLTARCLLCSVRLRWSARPRTA